MRYGTYVDSMYATERELGNNTTVVPGRDGSSEVVHCLCAHKTFLQMIPVNYHSWGKKSFYIIQSCQLLAKAWLLLGGEPRNSEDSVADHARHDLNLPDTPNTTEIEYYLECRWKWHKE